MGDQRRVAWEAAAPEADVRLAGSFQSAPA
jgi:hypothetical protein